MITAVLTMGLCLIGMAFINLSMTHSSAYAGNNIISGLLCTASLILVVLKWRAWKRLRIVGGLAAVLAILQIILIVSKLCYGGGKGVQSDSVMEKTE